MTDYWFAAHFGRAWLALRRRAGLRPMGVGLPDLCERVARGLPARELGMAQDFATAVWWRLAVAAIIPFLVIVVAAKGAFHGTALGALDGLLLALVFSTVIALLQSGMAFVRAGF
jgi:hypothetical protein